MDKNSNSETGPKLDHVAEDWEMDKERQTGSVF
jgi:hypothetical protein